MGTGRWHTSTPLKADACFRCHRCLWGRCGAACRAPLWANARPQGTTGPWLGRSPLTALHRVALAAVQCTTRTNTALALRCNGGISNNYVNRGSHIALVSDGDFGQRPLEVDGDIQCSARFSAARKPSPCHANSAIRLGALPGEPPRPPWRGLHSTRVPSTSVLGSQAQSSTNHTCAMIRQKRLEPHDALVREKITGEP